MTDHKKNPSTQSLVIEVSPKGRYKCYNDILGRGAYKIVYRAYDTHNGIEVAWNSIYIGKLSENEIKSSMQEISVLKEISSQNNNIINFFNAWIDYDKFNIVFITEIALSGTLYDYIRKIKNINMRVIKKWCIQILKGLAFLHDKNIAHRDLKCNNIFYNSNTGSIIIGDFGLANKKDTNFHSVIGTPGYMAPEMYNECYNEKVDLYAFGMCMLEMITQEIPYKNDPFGVIFKKVTSGILPQNIEKIKNDKAKDIILNCLIVNPLKRPSASQLLKKSFFKIIEENDNDDNLCIGEDIKEKNSGHYNEDYNVEILSTQEEVDDISINQNDDNSDDSSKEEIDEISINNNSDGYDDRYDDNYEDDGEDNGEYNSEDFDNSGEYNSNEISEDCKDCSDVISTGDGITEILSSVQK